jgi:hypothetical protein
MILSAGVTVASTSLTAGTLTIAAQTDVPRQLAAIIYPGTTSITAGSLVYTYTANDSTAQVDTLSLVMASQARKGRIRDDGDALTLGHL